MENSGCEGNTSSAECETMHALLEESEILSRVMLGQCYAAAVLLSVCLYCLNRQLFNRYRLGCVLILRWNCAADVACLLNKASFALANRYQTLFMDSRHLMAWVCKLYHLGDNLTMSLQTWLLILFALERAAVSVDVRFGLKHFSQFRLKIGASVAAVVTVAAHLNHIWMFGITREGGGIIGYASSGGSNGTNKTAGQENYEQRVSYICGVTRDFREIYQFAAVLELLANVYAPMLVCTASVAVVLARWARNGVERPSQAGVRLTARIVDGRDAAASANAAAVAATAVASGTGALTRLDRFNRSVKLLQLCITLVCYPPLAATGLFKAASVHHRLPLSPRVYPILEYIVQPLKNVLSSLVVAGFVGHQICATWLARRRRARCRSVRRDTQHHQQHPDGRHYEDNIPLRILN